MTSYAEIVDEYGHKCTMEYKVEYQMCEACADPNSVFATNKCTCNEMPHYVSEECAKCVQIHNDVQHLKSEILRAAMNYGMEVAETLEPNPEFAADIDNLVSRIKMMERLLMFQKIEAEANAELDDHMSVVTSESAQEEDFESVQSNDMEVDIESSHHDAEMLIEEFGDKLLVTEECATESEVMDVDNSTTRAPLAPKALRSLVK